MAFTKTNINEVIVFEPKVWGDNRGYFFESYNKELFTKNGIDCDFVQNNQSYSKYGTIRGLHYQKGEHSQAKLVRAIKGKVLDVAVDIRPTSPTFGQHVAVELSEDNNRQLFIPRGFAHGFAVLSEDAIFSYKCDNGYSPESESGLMYNDPRLNIDWKIPAEHHILSDKDKIWESFEKYKGNPCF
ncbi:MAG: dTDP-4-dehydrorhamnose 3,5-epimerase [Alphaproteobacteria bacterium]|nr:dTDP-4-dehydrorhamnose 3,5-epimerase [Alphaproteobacteria bacterium]